MRYLLASAFSILALPVWAGPMIDFSQGPLGNLHTESTTVQGVRADSFGGSLYRRNDPDDHGFGVCGPWEWCWTEDNELDGHEAMILNLPAGYRWTGLWLSSVDGNEAGYFMLDYEVPPTRFMATGGRYVRGGEVLIPIEGMIQLDSVFPELRIFPDPALCDNDFLVWGVDIEPIDTVPEPGTLTLLGLGLAWVGRRLRR